MPQIQANGLVFEYESFGNPRDPTLLLIMGLGGQLVFWPEAFCEALAAGGYHVIRYDNRDVGLSSKMDHLGRPDLLRMGLRWTLGLKVQAPYALDDMARDAVGLLDALGIARAHLVGISMGGMIAQLLALDHPDRVLSLTSIMSNSGSRRIPGPRLPLRLRMIRPPQRRDREGLIAHSVRTWQLIGSPGYPAEPAELLARIRRAHDRSHFPRGMARHTAAIMAAPSRAARLRRLQLPTLILHGQDDPLVPVAAAHDLQRQIPHARLHVIPGMGHDLPAALLPRLQGLILGHVSGA